jgi:hypothetical protein
MNLLVGAFLVGLCISFVQDADRSISSVELWILVIVGTLGIFFLYWGMRAAADQIEIVKTEFALANAEKARRNAEKALWKELQEAEARAQADAEEGAPLEDEVERTRRLELRDADSQDTPYEYQCIGHPNVTLALRYGIANTCRSSRDERERSRTSATIRLQKIRKVREDEAGAQYLAGLPDFGGRQVKVVIRPGTEFVLTFLPISDTWFSEHEDLERLLKDNPTFTLKELATFHVQAVLNTKR